MAFSVTYSFNNGATTGTATSITALRSAIYNYAHSGSISSSTGSDYSHLTQCTLSGTAEGQLTSNEQGTSTGTDYGVLYGCSSLTSLDLSNFDTSNVTDMTRMFYNCTSLTSLDLSNFDTSNATTMYAMFANCSSLASLNLSSFDTSNVTSMTFMFSDCSNLEHIYVGDNWNTSGVTNSANMFSSCTKLPNFNSSVTNKTNAHTGTGGYLNYIGELIGNAEIYYKYNNAIFKLKAGENFPTIEVTATGSYKPTASSNSNYGACINKNGYMIIYAYSYSTAYEHYNFAKNTTTSIPSTFGTIADGWNLTNWDTSDNATHLEACTIKGIDVSKYSKINVALNFSRVDSSYDYVTCGVTITTE